MEPSGRGSRKSLKGKLVRSFYKATKSTTSSTQYYNSMVVKPPTASFGYLVDDTSNYVPKPTAPKHKSSLAMVDVVRVARADYGDHAGDDNVDKRAALYISSMQERFRLSQIDHDWR